MQSHQSSASSGRRAFLSTLAGAGLASLYPLEGISRAFQIQEKLTVQQVINLFLKEAKGAPFNNTVDTLKAGSPEQEVSGIVTTMFPTVDVIRETIRLKANFIIVHEPSYYSHTDDTRWLNDDAVYASKRSLLDEHKIAIWRCHDYIHAHRPDGVLAGVVAALGWAQQQDADNPRLIRITPITLREVAEHAKARLGIDHVKVIGNLSQSCGRVALLPGACGGNCQISTLQSLQPDVLLVGEINEWETAEYIRDAQTFGRGMSLVVLGHVVSEEPGMRWMAEWLRPRVGSLQVTHLTSNDPFQWI